MKGDGGQWIDIPNLDQHASDAFGTSIRNYHAKLLSGNSSVDANEPMNILRSLVIPSQGGS